MTLPLPPIFRADRWGNHWSKDGVLLRFGNSSMSTGVRQDVQSAATLAKALKNAVAEYEATHGTLWSEDALANGSTSDANLPVERLPFLAAEGLSLYRMVKNLPLDGLEQSFKFRQGELLDNRFLVGISRSKFSDEDLQCLAERMGAPEEFRCAIREQVSACHFIHVGFEQGKQGSTYKLYLEFPLIRDANPRDAPPLYRGFKWVAQDKSQRGISTYGQPLAMAPARMLASVANAFAGSGSVISGAAQRIMERVAEKMPEKKLSVVEVRDSESPRASFDVNLYDAGLKVEELAPFLVDLASAFASPEGYSEVIARAQGHWTGHISGGTDSSGRPFLTLYHTRSRPPSSVMGGRPRCQAAQPSQQPAQ